MDDFHSRDRLYGGGFGVWANGAGDGEAFPFCFSNSAGRAADIRSSGGDNDSASATGHDGPIARTSSAQRGIARDNGARRPGSHNPCIRGSCTAPNRTSAIL